jgi:uncharacterized protein (TIGR02271 family)
MMTADMTAKHTSKVIDLDGISGTIERTSLQGAGVTSVLIQLEGGEQLLVPREMLVEQGDGTYRIDTRLARLLEAQGDDALVLPVIEETAHVRRVATTTGKVAVTKSVQERIETIDEPLITEEVTVERVTINRPVDEAPTIRHDGDTLVIPLLEEEMVVEKRLVLREEVRVRKLSKETHSPQEVSLRSEQIEISRQPISSADEQSD